MKHLNQDQIEWLYNEHYHEYKALEKEAAKPMHGIPMKDRSKDFKGYLVGSIDKYFSDIEANQKFEPNAKEREEMTYNEMKKQEAESKAKFKGGKIICVKKYLDKNS